MKRQWKPGDMAETAYRGVKSTSFVVEGLLCPEDHPRYPHWHGKSGGWNHLNDSLVQFRPLVVIDPEDREQVGRLAALYTDKSVNPGVAAIPGMAATRIQNALRALIAPPQARGADRARSRGRGRGWRALDPRRARQRRPDP